MTMSYLPSAERSRSILRIWNGAASLSSLLNKTLPNCGVSAAYVEQFISYSDFSMVNK
jgi:hypothetical protein